MDLTTVIENLLDTFATGNKDEIDEAVGLTRMILRATRANPPVDSTALTHLVRNDDHGTYHGPFSEADADAFMKAVVASGEDADVLAFEPLATAPAQPAAPALPPGYTTDPKARISAIPKGSLYR